MVAFNEISPTLRVPSVSVEFDPSNAQQGPTLLPYTALIIGQKTTAGTAAADAVYRITDDSQAITLGGPGSMLHRQAVNWYANNNRTELWLAVLDDDGAGVQATDTITVTVTTAETGVIALYLGAERLTIGVAAGDVQDDIAAAIAAEINANPNLPVTAAAATNIVTVTQKNAGTHGNDYDIRDSYNPGEALPVGVSLAYADGVAGAGNPDLTNLIAVLGDSWYQVVAHPYTDATNLTALETEWADRFGPDRQVDGVLVTSAAGTFATLAALGATRNSPHNSIVAQPGSNPLVPPLEFAAEQAALVAFYGEQDPARPFQTLALSRAIQPAEADLFTFQERDQLLKTGIATSRAGAGGVVQMERVITTYQTNAAGAPDTAYLDVNTLLNLLFLRADFRATMQRKFPRHKLADDGTQFGSGQFIVTPRIAKAAAVNWFEEKQQLGLVENPRQFNRDLIVERNAGDPNRLDFFLPPDLINGLRIIAAALGFRL